MGVCPAAPPSLHSHMISILRGTHTRHASVPHLSCMVSFPGVKPVVGLARLRIGSKKRMDARTDGRREDRQEGRKGEKKEVSTEGRKEVRKEGS